MMNEIFWATGRGAGLVSLGLLTVTVIIGVFARSGRRILGVERFSWQLVHRDAALLSCSLVGVHVLSLLFDPYAKLIVADVVIPFQAGANPIWVGLGTLGLDLIVAITVTGLLRARLGPRVFHGVHYATYPLWIIAVGHAIGSGTDMRSGLALAITILVSLLTVGIVLGINAHRFTRKEVMRG